MNDTGKPKLKETTMELVNQNAKPQIDAKLQAVPEGPARSLAQKGIDKTLEKIVNTAIDTACDKAVQQLIGNA